MFTEQKAGYFDFQEHQDDGGGEEHHEPPPEEEHHDQHQDDSGGEEHHEPPPEEEHQGAPDTQWDEGAPPPEDASAEQVAQWEAESEASQTDHAPGDDHDTKWPEGGGYGDDQGALEHGGEYGDHGGEYGETGGEYGETGGEYGDHGGEYGDHGGEYGETGGEYGETGGEYGAYGGEYGAFDANVPPSTIELDDAPAGVQDIFAQAEAGAITYEEAYEKAEDDFAWTSEAHDDAAHGEYGSGEYGTESGEGSDEYIAAAGEDEETLDEDEDEDWDDDPEDDAEHDHEDSEDDEDDTGVGTEALA